MSDHKKLTNDVGSHVAANDHPITFRFRDSIAIQDLWLIEKTTHFNR